MPFGSIDPDEIINPRKRGPSHWKFPSRLSPSLVLWAFVLIVIIPGIFYTIQQDEVGVVLRFGKLSRMSQPGLNLKIPLGIEQVYKVKVAKIYQEEFGFRTKLAGVKTIYSQKSYQDESLILTGDLNVLDVEWIIQYKIKDPYAQLFHIRNVRKSIRDLAESIVRKTIGDYTFDEVLPKRAEINGFVAQALQKVLDSYDAGILIEEVKLQDVTPPDPVKPAFNEVNEAKQEKEKLINQAWEIYNQKIPQAKGQALKMIREAEGYALEIVNTAQGDAQRFELLRDAYSQAKEVTAQRLYLENMMNVFKKTGKKYIIDPEQSGILPLLQLQNE